MTKSELIQSIYAAFKDVSLEDGIGLYEADCIDEYISPSDPIYINCKQKDERQNWENLLPLFLTKGPHERVHSANFFFMDAKGKRFHLPCYLLQDLNQEFEGNNPLILAITSDFDILNASQRQCILDFFEYKIEQFTEDNNDYDFEQYIQAKNIFIKSS